MTSIVIIESAERLTLGELYGYRDKYRRALGRAVCATGRRLIIDALTDVQAWIAIREARRAGAS